MSYSALEIIKCQNNFCDINNILHSIKYYRVIQVEPDFHLLNLSSVKKRYQPSDSQ